MKTLPNSFGPILAILLALCFLTQCSPIRLGSRFKVRPTEAIKVGHDHQKDVLKKMGNPYRRSVDPKGRALFTYVWTDGEGKGEKCTVAFNKNGVVALVEVSP